MGTLALDFDGVIRKWPYPVQKYADFLSPNDILVRAKLFFLRKLLSKIFMHYFPTIIDGELIEGIKRKWKGRIIIVTGRYTPEEVEEVRKRVLPYLKVDKIYFRENPGEYEEKFKERILKLEKVDYFIEDRYFVVNYLRRKGINAIKIDQLRGKKCELRLNFSSLEAL